MLMKMIAVALCMAGMTTTANAAAHEAAEAVAACVTECSVTFTAVDILACTGSAGTDMTAALACSADLTACTFACADVDGSISDIVDADDSAGDDFLGGLVDGLVDGLGAGVDMAACALDCNDKFTTADIMQCTMAASTDLAAVTACSADLLACTDACTGGAIGDIVDGVSDTVGEMTAAAAAAAGEIAAAALAELSDSCVDITKTLSAMKALRDHQISSCAPNCRASIGHKFTSCAMFSATCLKDAKDMYAEMSAQYYSADDDDDNDAAHFYSEALVFMKKCGHQAELDGFYGCSEGDRARRAAHACALDCAEKFTTADIMACALAAGTDIAAVTACSADLLACTTACAGDVSFEYSESYGYETSSSAKAATDDDDFTAADCDDYCEEDDDKQDDDYVDYAEVACSAFDEAVTAAKVACEITGDCTAVNAAVAKGASEQAAADSFAAGSSAKTVQVAASLVGVAVMAWIV